MAGGLMQLVAYGAQDVFLTGTPKSPSGKYLTDVTLTLLWKASNKPFLVKPTSVAVLPAPSAETVILPIVPTFK